MSVRGTKYHMKTVFATTTAPGHVNPMLAANAARRHPVRTSITTGITYVRRSWPRVPAYRHLQRDSPGDRRGVAELGWEHRCKEGQRETHLFAMTNSLSGPDATYNISERDTESSNRVAFHTTPGIGRRGKAIREPSRRLRKASRWPRIDLSPEEKRRMNSTHGLAQLREFTQNRGALFQSDGSKPADINLRWHGRTANA